MTDMPEILTL